MAERLGKITKLLGLCSSDESKRYEARYRIISRLAKIFSFRLYPMHQTWYWDPEFLEVWSKSKFYDGHPENIEGSKFALFQLVKAVNRVNGDTAECGVYQGASSYIILKVNQNSGKMHHVFDSFEGLSDPHVKDEVFAKGAFKWKMHDLRCPQAKVRDNLEEFESVKFYTGWIPERFSEVSDRQFSFVHIDVDLYQPTLDSLAFFYPRVSPAGIIVCDDYGFETCLGAKRACDEFLNEKKEEIIHLPTGQGIIIKS